jgi:hypothetical protein
MSLGIVYAKAVKIHLDLLLAGVLAMSAWAQAPPQFQDYPVKGIFKGVPTLPVFEIPEERKFEAEILDGVTQGWGVYDGASGKEFRRPGPNFAGHYVLVNFGCGEPTLTACFAAAIVDEKTGRLYRAPFPAPGSGFRLPYFGVFVERPGRYRPFSFHNFPLKSPLAYRLNSRLLIADVCERSFLAGGSVVAPMAGGCGAHYYLMRDDGLTLIRRIVRDLPLNQ